VPKQAEKRPKFEKVTVTFEKYPFGFSCRTGKKGKNLRVAKVHPSWKGKVEVGWILFQIDGGKVLNMDYKEIMERLKKVEVPTKIAFLRPMDSTTGNKEGSKEFSKTAIQNRLMECINQVTRNSQSWQKVIEKLRLEYADLEEAVCEYAMHSNLNKMRTNLEEGKQLKVFVFSALDDLYAKASAEKEPIKPDDDLSLFQVPQKSKNLPAKQTKQLIEEKRPKKKSYRPYTCKKPQEWNSEEMITFIEDYCKLSNLSEEIKENNIDGTSIDKWIQTERIEKEYLQMCLSNQREDLVSPLLIPNIVTKILSFVPLQYRVTTVSTVCKMWNSCVHLPESWDTIHLNVWSMNALTSLDSHEFLSHLRVVHFNSLGLDMDEFIWKESKWRDFLTNFPSNPKMISFSNFNKKLSTERVSRSLTILSLLSDFIQKAAQDLRYLRLTDVGGNFSGLVILPSQSNWVCGLPNLEHLVLSNVANVSLKLWRNVKHVKKICLVEYSKLSRKHMSAISRNCGELEYLLVSCEGDDIDPALTDPICDSFPLLKALVLKNVPCEPRTEVSIQLHRILIRHRNLELLSLDWKLSEQDVLEICNIAGNTLIVLELNVNEDFNANILQYVLAKCPNLKRAHIQNGKDDFVFHENGNKYGRDTFSFFTHAFGAVDAFHLLPEPQTRAIDPVVPYIEESDSSTSDSETGESDSESSSSSATDSSSSDSVIILNKQTTI